MSFTHQFDGFDLERTTVWTPGKRRKDVRGAQKQETRHMAGSPALR